MIINNKNRIVSLIFFGVILFHLYAFVEYLCLGQSIVIVPHDQFDLEVLCFYLKSRSFSDFFKSSFSCLMCGKTDLEVSNFFGVLLFYVFPPVYAYIINMFIVRIIAYLGLYFLLKELNVDRIICIVTGFAFSMLPFYSVYGLNVMGLPFIVFVFLKLKCGRVSLKYYAAIAFFGLYSSLVLAGFYIIPCLLCVIILRFRKRKSIKEVLLGFLILLITYSITNIHVFTSVIGNSSFVSHRTEFVYEPIDFKQNFVQLYKIGHFHAVSWHNFFSGFLRVLSIVLVSPKVWRKNKKKALYCVEIWSIIVFIALFYAMFNSNIGISARKMIFGDSFLMSFQFDRIYWLYPSLWYCLAAILIDISIEYFVESALYIRFKRLVKNKDDGSISNFICKHGIKTDSLIRIISIIIILNLCFYYVIDSSDVTYVVRRENDAMDITWEQFYETDIFSRIENYIGEDKKTYRVVSIGLYPSIPLFNGFRCVDGYSQNYDVEYKHIFYDIQKDELDKNPALKDYFCNWGSRCYIFSNDLGRNYYVSKENKDTIVLNIDTKRLKELDCFYIFSTVRIVNTDDLNIELLDFFDDINSKYGIFVYRIK